MTLALSDQDLLVGLLQDGDRLHQAGQEQLAALGDVVDDERWQPPLPLRFEVQASVLFLGALDAFDVTAGVLGRRVSQQAFNGVRFLLESWALIDWLAKDPDPDERRHRAYRFVRSQITRWEKFLMQDAGEDREAFEGVHEVREWGRRLRQIAEADGIPHLKEAPDRRARFEMLDEKRLGPSGGYATFSMLSELGSHPGAAGNTFFSMTRGSRRISYDFAGSVIPRAHWVATSIVLLWLVCEDVSDALGWDEWLGSAARPVYHASLPLIVEVRRRYQATQGSAT